MASLIKNRVQAVYFSRNALVVDLMDGRTISIPLTWYPRLLKATPKQRSNWEILGKGQGIHWPDIDEDLSVDGLLRGIRAPQPKKKTSSHQRRGHSGSRGAEGAEKKIKKAKQ